VAAKAKAYTVVSIGVVSRPYEFSTALGNSLIYVPFIYMFVYLLTVKCKNNLFAQMTVTSRTN